MVDRNLELDAVNKVWAAFGSKKRGGIFNNFLEFLEEKPRTEKEMSEFLLSDKSSYNEARWFNQRNHIRLMTIQIFKNHGVEFVEEAETEELKKAREAAVKSISKS